MDGEILTWIFLAGGLLLMLIEFAIPGGIAFILGFSGLVVGALRFFDILTSTGGSVATWLFLSVALTIAIRPLISKYFKPESSFKYADEDYEAMDQIAVVTEDVSEEESGKIRFNGTTWRARSLQGTIRAGEQVRIKYRENITWIVEAIGVQEPSKEQLKNLNRN
jgi:membrane protein implicated in regulation of membrane protease activity